MLVDIPLTFQKVQKPHMLEYLGIPWIPYSQTITLEYENLESLEYKQQTSDVCFFFVTLSMLATALRPLARIARMGFLNFDSLIPLVI